MQELGPENLRRAEKEIDLFRADGLKFPTLPCSLDAFIDVFEETHEVLALLSIPFHGY